MDKIDLTDLGRSLKALRAAFPLKPDARCYLGDMEVDVWFDYQPLEPATSTYPGCDEEVHITTIEFRGVDITEAVLSDARDCESIEDQCRDHIHAKDQERDYKEMRDE